jgi:Acetyltransferase (GNAT) domain
MAPIFHQPWWLEAVAPGRWNVLEVKVGEEVRARLPYVMKNGPLRLKLLSTPELTPYLGPWLAPSKAKYAKQLGQQKDLLNALLDQLPPHDYFCHRFHYIVTNWMPFYWRGFSSSTYYTYVIENLTDLDRIWNGLMENIRTDIRKAQKIVAIRTDLGIESFLDLNAQTFERQDRVPSYSRDYVRRIEAACAERQARKIFFAEDVQGRVHGAIFVVWDENSAYYLMGGRDSELRNSGATSLLMWEAIKFASTVTQKFDFEGSVIPPVERFFRAFGGVQKLGLVISRMSRRLKFLMAGRDMLRTLWSKT